MMSSLFEPIRHSDDPPPPPKPGAHRREDPDTSINAALSIDATRLERMVLSVITASGTWGCTSEECAMALAIELGSITPRMAPMKERGLILENGEKRPGKSGRGRNVLIAKEFAY